MCVSAFSVIVAAAAVANGETRGGSTSYRCADTVETLPRFDGREKLPSKPKPCLPSSAIYVAKAGFFISGGGRVIAAR